MLKLNMLKMLKKKRKRCGRGGSRGGTSGRGHKGQRGRSGSSSEIKPFFEGGQMPLPRRLPRRGFTNRSKKEYVLVNLETLEKNFQQGQRVTIQTLSAIGLVKGKKNMPVKVLGRGALTKALTVIVDKISENALQAVQKAGGTIELIKES